MTIDVKIDFESSVKVLCVKCQVLTNHAIKAQVRESGSDPHNAFNWWVKHQVLMCLGCESFTYRIASGDSEGYSPDEYGQYTDDHFVELFPPRLAGRKGINDEDLVLLDQKVRRIYEETMSALSAGNQVLAGIGLRAILETVCKERAAEGNDLQKKISWLQKNGVLTVHGAEILHDIRTLGNQAAHEVEPHSEEKLRLAMDVIESLLKDVFIYPERARKQFVRKSATTASAPIPP